MGSGDDRVTGNEGVDTFIGDPLSKNDLLLESRSGTFSLTNNELSISYKQKVADASGDTVEVSEEPLKEVEDVSLFESFILYGGADIDNFAISDFTKNAILDGTEGGDNYTITLSGVLSKASDVRILDSGSLSTDTDTLELQGSEKDDTIHLDVIDSLTDYEVDFTSLTSPLQFTYHGETTQLIDVNLDDTDANYLLNQRNAIESALQALDGIRDVIVTGEGVSGAGVNDKPWKIVLVDADQDSTGFYELSDANTNTQVTLLKTAIVERLANEVAEGLLAGAPNVDAMFDNPVNQQQLFFYRNDWPANLSSLAGTEFTLNYDGAVSNFEFNTSSLPASQTAQIDNFRQQLESALQVFDDAASITGTGSEQDPWRINLVDAKTDRHGNFYAVELTNVTKVDINGLSVNQFTDPTDIADAAAQTRASEDFGEIRDYQRVSYNFTVERVETHGRAGNDTFIVDDTAAAVNLYGDQGNDNFLVGRVLKTTTVMSDGKEVEIIDSTDLENPGITAGVSYNANLYGGSGDDYFEVNHNIGELELYGESGDDTFFLKAHLELNPDFGAVNQKETSEMAGGNISAAAGDEDGLIDPKDKDTLIDYVENNRVEIYGGSGFDTIVIAGTSFDDEFYIYTDQDDQQYLYGAGIKLENIDSIERLALVTGSGDDKVWLYGLDEGLSLLINLGSGNDEVIIGGKTESFEVTYPAAAATYTVNKEVTIEELINTVVTTDDISLVKRQFVAGVDDLEMQQLFRKFFKTWYPNVDETKVIIDRDHWNLLETNVATALWHFKVALQQTSSDRFNYGASLFDQYKTNALTALSAFNYTSAQAAQNSSTSGLANIGALLSSDQLAQMPERLQLTGIQDLLKGGNIWIDEWVDGPMGLLSIDDFLFSNYLREAIGYANYGDFLHGHVHTPVDISGSHIVTSEIPQAGASRGQLPHITGVDQKDESFIFISDDMVRDRGNNATGGDLLVDLLALFYDVEALNNVQYNIVETWQAAQVDGLASYRFANLPERTETRYIPESYDLSKIAGVVRIAGASGDDTITVNAKDDIALNVSISTETLNLGEFMFTGDPMQTESVQNAQALQTTILENGGNKLDADYVAQQVIIDTARQKQLDWLEATYVTTADGVEIKRVDVQDALIRAHKETSINVIDSLRDGTLATFDVSVSIDREVPGVTAGSADIKFTLENELLDIRSDWNVVNDNLSGYTWNSATESSNDASARQGWFRQLGDFIKHGLHLADTDYIDASADFSLDDLNGILISEQLEFLLANNGVAFDNLKTTLDSLHEYLTLTVVTKALDTKGYMALGESALQVYQQNTPVLGNSESVRSYTDGLWAQSDVNLGNSWNAAAGYFAKRIDLTDILGPVEALEITDTTDPTLALLEATVPGSTNINIGKNYDNRSGEIEILKEYSRQLAVLDKSYYTYSYESTNQLGVKVLSAMAINRVSDSVEKSALLESGVYLTAVNWDTYISAFYADSNYRRGTCGH